MGNDLVVDRAGDRIPEGNRAAIGPSRSVGGIPRTPLASRERPGAAAAQYVFELALVPHRVAHLARHVASGGPFEAVRADVGVIVLVDIHELERAEVDAIGTEGPGSIEEIGVEDLQGQSDPPAGRAAVNDAGVPLADSAKTLFDLRDELASDRRAIGSMIGRVDLIRVAQRSGTIQVDEDHRRRVVGHPGAVKFGAGGHHRADVREPRARSRRCGPSPGSDDRAAGRSREEE